MSIEPEVVDGELEAPRPTIEIDGIPCDLHKVREAARRIVLAIGHIRAFNIEHKLGSDDWREPSLVEALDCLAEVDEILKGETIAYPD